MNDKPNIKVETLKPFTKFIYTLGQLPSSYLASMSYEEQLIWLCNYLGQTVIPAVNNTGAAVTELQNLFIELQTYVNEYFDNLDVQEEINAKLDDMAESGTLADIIAQYIQLQGQLTYSTVEEMKQAENITDGSFLKTYGFYNYNDGGGALYKARPVTNVDDVDEISLIALNDPSLVAELIYSEEINGAALGIIPDLESDMKDRFNFVASNGKIKILNLQKGTYNVSEKVTFDHDITINGNNAVILSETEDDALEFTGTLKGETTLSSESNYLTSPFIFNLTSTEHVEVGDLLVIKSDTNFNSERAYYKKGIAGIVEGINSNAITLSINPVYNIEDDSVVLIYSPIKVVINNLTIKGKNNLTINSSGEAVSQALGVVLLHTYNSTLNNITTDNFLGNIEIIECYNTLCDKVTTLNAMPTNPTLHSFNAYGLDLIGTSYATIKNSTFCSGTHGLTYGNSGMYPITAHNIEIVNCNISSQTGGVGFGAHHNALNILIDNCTLNGWLLANNCIVKNSKLYNNSANNAIYYGDDAKYYNYTFENCEFATDGNYASLRLNRAPFSGQTLVDNTIDYLKFVKCKNFQINLITMSADNVQTTSPVINTIYIQECKNAFIYQQNYKIHNIYVDKLNNDALNISNFQIKDTDNFYISHSVIPIRYRIMYIQNQTKVVMNDVEFYESNLGTSCTIEVTNADASIYMNNVTSIINHISLVLPGTGCNLYMNKSIMNCYRFNFNIFTGKTLIIKDSVTAGTNYNAITNIYQNASGDHFTMAIAADGTATYTPIA